MQSIHAIMLAITFILLVLLFGIPGAMVTLVIALYVE
jgi:hypothetical protein